MILDYSIYPTRAFSRQQPYQIEVVRVVLELTVSETAYRGEHTDRSQRRPNRVTMLSPNNIVDHYTGPTRQWSLLVADRELRANGLSGLVA